MLRARELVASVVTSEFVAGVPSERAIPVTALAMISSRSDLWQTYVATTAFSRASGRLVSSVVGDLAEAAVTDNLERLGAFFRFVESEHLRIERRTLLGGGRILHSMMPAPFLIAAAMDAELLRYCMQKCGDDIDCFEKCYGENP